MKNYKANKLNATVDQITIWFQNRRRRFQAATGQKAKRLDSESDLSDDDNAILIPPPPPSQILPNNTGSNTENTASSEDEKPKVYVKPVLKKNTKWKVMEDLDEIQFIQQFYVCDICELRHGEMNSN